MSTDVWVELRRNYDKNVSLLPLIQARVFEEAANRGLDSEKFMDTYMNSEIAAMMDYPNYRGLWSDKRFLLGQVLREKEVPPGYTWGENQFFDVGYTYRYWALATRQTSKKIYQIADCDQMFRLYFGRHFECPENLILDALDAKNIDIHDFVPEKN